MMVPAVRLHAHLHYHVHGPRVDYLALCMAAAASWSGVPGPGEAALIAAGVLAAHHRLDIAAVVLVAWVGATAGGIAGWLVARKAGRTVLAARGPLRRARLAALAQGDRFFERYGTLAVFLTPSWVAGIHGMRASRYLPSNAAAALVWSLLIGLGSFLLGPSIADVASDLGVAGAVIIAATVAATFAARTLESRRRRRRCP